MADYRSDQFCNPHGECGRAVLTEMNEHHRPLSEWALSNLPDIHPRTILDIGCGGGMLISLLGERFPDTAIAGIDISDDAIEYASKVNERLIEERRCIIRKASVDRIPFERENIDLAISCESYFFWPDLVHAIEEISRTICDGGYIVIISEAYPHPNFKEINDRHAKDYGMSLVSNDYMEALLGTFGFDVKVITKEENNWVQFIGRKINGASVFL